MSGKPVDFPGQFAPGIALAFAGPDSLTRLVSSVDRLPVDTAPAPASPAVSGSMAASGVTGPFPVAGGRTLSLVLSGTWSGTVTVRRSTDGGATKVPLTVSGTPWAVFNTNCCEPVWEESEEGATFFLDVSLTNGTLTYRMGQ